MSFGQPSGPPATARQLRELTALVEAAGHAGFKDARGPLGLNQRQAGGRFTQAEAEALIARLETEEEGAADDGTGPGGADGPVAERTTRSAPVGPVGPAAPRRAAPRTSGARATTLAKQLERVPEQLLVDEMRRRGWRLIPPSLDA